MLRHYAADVYSTLTQEFVRQAFEYAEDEEEARVIMTYELSPYERLGESIEDVSFDPESTA
jgi:hypothetical protein